MAAPVPTIPPGDDWPAQAADTIVKVIGQVRDATTEKAMFGARGVVYGTLVAIFGLVALVLTSVLVSRVLVVAIDALLGLFDLDRPGRAVWISHLVLAAIFAGIGLKVWKKATAPVD